MLETIISTLLLIISFYLILNIAYILFFALAGHINRDDLINEDVKKKKICIFFPCYKADNVILNSALSAKKQYYAGEYDICVIADGLKQETILTLLSNEIKVVVVKFEKSTKGKALLFAVNEMANQIYEIALVLDADNHMANSSYLNSINNSLSSKYKAVQTHRTAKNIDSNFAFLDACNEEINNHIYRKGHFNVGLSPALIGSGMAFDYQYLRNLLTNIGDSVGEDKELDLKIARDKQKICYLNNVYVYDEKIENAEIFTQQRTRWIAAQVDIMKKYTLVGVKELILYGNIGFFNKVLHSLLLPRMLLIGALFIMILQAFFNPWSPSVILFICMESILFFSLAISLPIRFYKDKRLITATAQIPYAIFCMVLALFGIKKAKKSFIPTPHKEVNISSHINSK